MPRLVVLGNGNARRESGSGSGSCAYNSLELLRLEHELVLQPDVLL
jgi:hypothetical protein